jgi:hypothetical protein
MTPTLAGRLVAHERVGVEAEHGDGRAQDVHDVRILRGLAEELDHRRGQGARGAQVGLQLLQLGLGREPVVPEQKDDLLVMHAADQLVDVVAAVDENALLALHIAEARGGGDDPLQSRRRDRHVESINKAHANLRRKKSIAPALSGKCAARNAR